jgi:hypothetical protein
MIETNLNRDFLSILEAPWLKKQVETHLIFGFCARNVPLGLLFSVLCVVYVVFDVLNSKSSFLVHLLNSLEPIFFIIAGLCLMKMPKYQQAAIGWWVVKGSLFLVCTTTLVGYGLVGFFKGSPDAVHLTLLGLVWFPSIEFVPRLIEKQKFITIARISVSIPLLVLWHQTGTWQ